MPRPALFGVLIGTTLAVAALVAACSSLEMGSPSPIPRSPGSSSGTSGTTTSDVDSVCDTATEGDLCSIGTNCESGEHASGACNARLICSSGRWKSPSPEPPLGCTLPCPPAYVAELPDGCAAPNARDLLCEYPEGTCGCTPVGPFAADGGGGGDGGEPDQQDAGDAGPDAAKPPSAYMWTCTKPGAGCPRTRPHVGMLCVQPIECDYGTSLFADGRTMKCCSGYWNDDVSCNQL